MNERSFDITPLLGDMTELSQSHVIVKYRVKFNATGNSSFLEHVAKMIVESSIGWSQFTGTASKGASNNFLGRIIDHNEDPVSKLQQTQSGTVTVAYHMDTCGLEEGIPMLLSTLCYISVYDFIGGFRLLDAMFPPEFLKGYQGPRLGVQGIRKYFNESNRPLLGLVLKPRHGASIEDYSKLAYEACRGGVDYITDDELMVDPPTCKFEERIPKIAKAVEQASKDSNLPKCYIPNITSKPEKLERLYKIAEDVGCGGVQINVWTVGFALVQQLREDNTKKMPLFLSKIGRGVITRGDDFGIDTAFLCRLSRMVGGDAVYTGALAGWLHWQKDELRNTCSKLQNQWSNFNSSFSISSGGMDITNLYENMSIHRNGTQVDLMIQMGTNLTTYPDGVKAGSRITRRIINMITPGMTRAELDSILIKESEKTSKDGKELKEGLKYFKWQSPTK
jgi:ribulose 1,5-bisphosphate carboxylase large subunit-like protein